MYRSRKVRLIQHEGFPLSQFLRGNCYAIEEVVNPGYRYRIRKTSYLALILTRSGVSDYTINGHFHRIEPNSLFILPPGISFSEHVPAPHPCHNIYLMLEGPLALEWCRSFDFRAPFLYWKPPPSRADAALAAIVQKIHTNPIQDSWSITADLCHLALGLKEALAVSDADHAMATKLERLVEQDPAASWSVKKMASTFGMSESSFAHTFRAEAGLAPAAWIRRLRCRLARTFLEEGQSVAEVAEQVGFLNPYHFSRVFKAETGQPPSTHKNRLPSLHRVG